MSDERRQPSSEVPRAAEPLGPDSLTWTYFGDWRGVLLAPWAGAMQNMHPQLGAGVAEHSRFFEERWQRLFRSLYPIGGVVYDGPRAAETARRVRHYHDTVRGVDARGRPYHALDPDTFYWAHATFFVLTLLVADRLGPGLSEAEKRRLFDEHVQWWRMYGMSMRPVPANWPEFRAYWDRMAAEVLEDNQPARDVLDLRRIARPPALSWLPAPLWRAARGPLARFTVWFTVGFFPPAVRRRLGYRWTPRDERRLRRLGQLVHHVWRLVPEPYRYHPRARAARRRAAGGLPEDAAPVETPARNLPPEAERASPRHYVPGEYAPDEPAPGERAPTVPGTGRGRRLRRPLRWSGTSARCGEWSGTGMEPADSQPADGQPAGGNGESGVRREPGEAPEETVPRGGREPRRAAALAGFTVAVTAARRAAEFGALLERRGAEVVHAPAMRTVPLADDAELRAATEQLVEHPPDTVVVTTAVGFRGWIEAAEGWGLGDALRDRLAGAELLARGPKARGAVRAAGLRESWSPASESTDEVRERLLADAAGVDGRPSGRRIAVQLHGEPLTGFVESLRGAGAEVVPVPVYRWLPPEDLAPLDRLVDRLAGGEATGGTPVDAVTFTSAPAAVSLLERAERRGVRDALLAALRDDVLVACVGPVTAAPLERHGVPTVRPERFRLGPLVDLLCRELPARAPELTVAGRSVAVRGRTAVVDGEPRELSAGEAAVLRTLARRPGRPVARTRLARELPGFSGQFAGAETGTGAGSPGAAGSGSGSAEPGVRALEKAIARLRRVLGEPQAIESVGADEETAEPGYRLAAE